MASIDNRQVNRLYAQIHFADAVIPRVEDKEDDPAMVDHMPEDVSPAGRDLRAYTDELRPLYPVIRNNVGDWVLLRHADIVAAALDDKRFSSAVSRHLQIPNGLDFSFSVMSSTIS